MVWINLCTNLYTIQIFVNKYVYKWYADIYIRISDNYFKFNETNKFSRTITVLN